MKQILRARWWIDSRLPVLAARAGSVLSQFLFTVVLARMLGKDEFADFMLAYGILRLASGGLANGACALLARRAALTQTASGAQDSYFQWLFLFSLGLALAIAGGLIAIGAALGLPLLSGKLLWWVGLSPMFVLGVVAPMEMTRHDLRGDVAAATLWADFGPNALRILLIAALSMTNFSAWNLCLVIGLTQALPLVPELLNWRRHGLASLKSGQFDMLFYFKYVVQYFMGVQIMGIDLILLALLNAVPDAAEYILATRILSFAAFVPAIITRSESFGLAKIFRGGDRAQLRTAIVKTNERSLCAAILSIGGLLLLGPVLLGALGKTFAFKPELMCAIAAVFVIYSSMSVLELLTRINGLANIALGVLLAGDLILILCALILGPHFGAIAVAGGLLASAAVMMTMNLNVFARRMDILAVDRNILFMIASALLLLLLMSFFPVGGLRWNSFSVALMALGAIRIFSLVETSGGRIWSFRQ